MEMKQLIERRNNAMKHKDTVHLNLYRAIIDRCKKIVIERKLPVEARDNPPKEILIEAMKKEHKQISETMEFDKAPEHHQQLMALEEMLPPILTEQAIKEIVEDNVGNVEIDPNSKVPEKIVVFKAMKQFFETNYPQACDMGVLKRIIDAR